MSRTPVIIATVLACLTASASGESVRDGYRRPSFVIPYAWQTPRIDGVVEDAEWQQALRVTALQTIAGQVSTRQATFSLCWDEENLYVAMQSPLRPGERVQQSLRRREPEQNVVFDDSYEVWIDAGTRTEDGQVCFFQFLANFAGARYDVPHLPAVGNSRINWSSGWEPVNRLTEDNVWEWEMAIPRTSLMLDRPFADGMALSMLLARNFKRPWEQNSIEGTGSFTVVETHSQYRLSKSAPAIHLRSVADPSRKTFGLDLAAWSKADGAVSWSFSSDGGVHESGDLSLTAGQWVEGPVMPALDGVGDGAYRIRVTSADGTVPLLDWSALRAFGAAEVAPTLDDRADKIRLSLALNPVADYLRVDGDFIDYEARDAFAAFRVSVTDASGAVVASSPLEMDDLAYVSGILKMPGLAPGEYTARLDCLDADGQIVLSRESAFTKKDHAEAFAWWNTEHGNIERVIAPWTPVRASASSVAVWGREVELGAAGLPAQVVSQERPILAAPVRLELIEDDGSVTSAAREAATLVNAADHRVVYEAASRLGELSLSSKVTVEFDGMYHVELTLTPRAPVAVKGLRMVVPFAGEQVDYFHSAGRGIRYGFDFGYIPEGTGRVWDSRRVSGNPMKVGSFVPYVVVTGPEAGLCWYADSDEGWIPNDDVPAFELRRDSAGTVDLVFNFISNEAVLREPRTITFAFQATPSKPMAKGWRMDSWWCGDTFLDFQFLGKNGGDQIWTNIPFTLDEEACRQLVKQRHEGNNSFIFGVDLPAWAVPYLEWKTLSARFAPEVAYFGDQWKTTVSDGLAFDETLSDYLVYHMYQWAKTCGIDGVYIDNNRPQACANIEAGRGYRLPDGRIQPTYNLFALRKLYLRMRAAFWEANGHSKFVLHTTNNLIAPWLGAADIAYDGEHHVIYPDMDKDFMDFWTPERLRLSYGPQWGVAVNFMHEFQGHWEPTRLARVFRSYTGACILFDALPSGNANGLNPPVWIARHRFGIDADDVTFIAPWNRDGALTCEQPDVHLAAWKRPGKILIAVVNYGEATDARLRVDGETLGLGSAEGWIVEDAEADTQVQVYDPAAKARVVAWRASDEGTITLNSDGTITVPVKRHDYRQVVIRRAAR